MLTLQKVVGNNNEEKLNEIEQYFFELSHPKVFWGSKGVEVNFINSFEKACTVLRQRQSKEPKEMTVLEFYRAIALLKEQAKEQEKALGNKKRK